MTSAGPVRSPLEAELVGRLLERPPTSARLPVGLLSREEKAAELQRLQVRKAMDAAYEADLVLGLAEDTPDTLDPPAGHPGGKRGSWAPDADLPGVSQFFPAELAVVLDCGRGTASHLAHRAWTYRENLPAARTPGGRPTYAPTPPIWRAGRPSPPSCPPTRPPRAST